MEYNKEYISDGLKALGTYNTIKHTLWPELHNPFPGVTETP
jgi:hypothetical protein